MAAFAPFRAAHAKSDPHRAKRAPVSVIKPLGCGQGAAKMLHCRSVSGSIVAASLEHESVVRIDPAIGVGTARGGHALGVAGELAIARIAPYSPLQAVATRCALISPRSVHGAICLSSGLPVWQGYTHRQNRQTRQSTHWSSRCRHNTQCTSTLGNIDPNQCARNSSRAQVRPPQSCASNLLSRLLVALALVFMTA